MRDDLLHAQASVDWAVAQLPDFTERIETWLRNNVDFGIVETKAPITHSPIIAEQKASLPLSFNVEVGAYINAIRSSLDILATTLSIRHSVGKPEDACFPIAHSAVAFVGGRYKGSKLVKGLPNAERAIIETLKPYKGGNEPLFALHQLDIMRKHRRLLSVKVAPGYRIFDTSGRGLSTSDFVLLGVGALSADYKPVLGFVRNVASDYKIEFTPQVALNEPASAEPPQVIHALSEFASLANSIIRLFDV